ncbi:TetR family transcriptional regulator [Cellulomonas hominis]|uniref:AcrR family transcriptional regulator n=1 Tax=Cellulomonas hominis TaxID=156981 RepID=A0A511FCM0_9CELL|nr:TetR/AcrR family transcriptional regulator [Cellulomonas hominis]MBB5472123.1 AcrR family transcriptional regulator [Cellulomonas hominis]GEL46953.1 TetR family transcriptional regulator [Cellulomonas hominis]
MPQPTPATAYSPRTTRTRMSASQRLTQILTVSAGLIAERGFRGLTLRDVALECGITEGGVLHHVGSKEQLLVAVLEYRDALDLAQLADLLGVEADVFDSGREAPVGLRELCAALVRRNARQPEIVRLYTVLNGESLDPAHPAHEYFLTRERWALDLFASAARGPEGEQQALQVLAAMDGLQLRWLRDLEGIDLVAEWDAIAGRLIAD